MTGLRRRSVVVLVLAIIGLTIGAAGIIWGPHWLAVDKCLDNGGSWDEHTNRCDYGK